jgi:O-acetyl-ADP-ribose deacetylase (regulator of RNase III)
MEELIHIRQQIGRCAPGGAVVTSAGHLPAQFVFHAVGPVYQDGHHGEPELLRSCYATCLDLAKERSLESISFPSISAGVYGYPLADAASIAINMAREWLKQNTTTLRVVKLVQFSRKDHEVYLQML